MKQGLLQASQQRWLQSEQLAKKRKLSLTALVTRQQLEVETWQQIESMTSLTPILVIIKIPAGNGRNQHQSVS